MAEYIELEALVKKINDRIEALVKEYGYYDHYTTGFTDCADMVEDEQSADVAPVRHGRWEFVNDYEGRCTSCHEEIFIDHTDEPNYCPNCGAKMDGGNAP